MSRSADARLANLLGAVAVGLTDRMQDAALDSVQLDGIEPAALIALLDFSPNGTVQALSQICGLTHSGGVRLVNRLAAAGYVKRAEGRNARSVTVVLTPSGKRAALKLRATRHAAVAATMNGLTKLERQELAEACVTLISALTEQRLDRRAAGKPVAGGALCRMCDFAACQRSEGNCPAAHTARSRSAP